MTKGDIMKKTPKKEAGFWSRTNSTTDEWLTPKSLVQSLGKFDVDPCAPPNHRRPFQHAPILFHGPDENHVNGLDEPWPGRAFVNPPYGRAMYKWMRRLADHKNGIALITPRTDTIGFFAEVWDKAEAVFFIKGRIKFIGVMPYEIYNSENEEIRIDARKKVGKNGLKPIIMENGKQSKTHGHYQNGGATAPSCLVAYSCADASAIALAARQGHIKGKLINLKEISAVA